MKEKETDTEKLANGKFILLQVLHFSVFKIKACFRT